MSFVTRVCAFMQSYCERKSGFCWACTSKI